jgi:hypothetical protein
MGWSIDGRRLEFRAALPSGKVVLLEGGAVVLEQKLKQAGEWVIPIGGASFQLVRVRRFMGPKTELKASDGTVIPQSKQPVVPSVAPPGSLCQPHQATARFGCARCGAFCCSACAGPDLTHCTACFGRLAKLEAKNAAAMRWLAPVPVFLVLGGPLAGILTAAAGAGVVAIAKRTERTSLKVAAAAGLYGLATGLWLLLVALLVAEPTG